MSSPTLVFFAAPGPAGEELCRDVSLLAQEMGLQFTAVPPESPLHATQAYLDEDVVVLDASREPEGCPVMERATPPTTFDHVLVVSRTYLPVNFFGPREGGAPPYPKTQSNPEILVWLRAELAALLPMLPRPADERGFPRMWTMMKRGLEKHDARRRSRGQVFLSYRSRHFARVEALAGKVRAGYQGAPPRTVHFFPPRSLIQDEELLTAHQRWQLLAILDRWMAPAEEVWLFASPDYLNSWWTRGEVLTLAYRQSSGTPIPRLFCFDPVREEVHPVPPEVLPRFRKDQLVRMARWYVNSDPYQVAPEHRRSAPLLRRIPLLGKRWDDPVWQDDWWDTPRAVCEICYRREGSYSGAGGELRGGPALDLPAFFERIHNLDIDAFLWLRGEGILEWSPEGKIDESAEVILRCASCGSRYRRVRQEHPRYYWVLEPPRLFSATGRAGYLEERPVYALESAAS